MLNLRLNAIFALLLLLVASGHAQEALKDSAAIDFRKPGFSKTKPTSGHFVEVEGGYMVEYTQQLPGTTIEFTMIPIEGGEFLLGTEARINVRKDECPQVPVRIEPFWMGKYEVTWKEYRKFIRLDETFRKFQEYRFRSVNDEADAISAPSDIYDPSFVFGAGDGENEPAAMMTPYAARQYTKYISLLTEQFYRLPTEAEWEYACRAGTTSRFYFGDSEEQLGDHAWYYDNSDDLRHSVGQKQPNPWGLYDMYGNVAEWVLDEYAEETYQYFAGQVKKKQINSLSAIEAYSPPTERLRRVCRGGSFELEPEDCRSAARLYSTWTWSDEDPNLPISPWWHTTSPSVGVGFRLFRPLVEPDDRLEKEAYWEPIELIREEVRERIEQSGRGSKGKVTPNLFEVIEKFQRLKGK